LTAVRLRRTTTSTSTRSTSRELGERTALRHRACLPHSPVLHQLRRALHRGRRVLHRL
jgi:hypothetical protein